MEEEKKKAEEKARLRKQGATAIPSRFERVSRRELVGEQVNTKVRAYNPPIFRTREPREGMRDFIQKKREMFIVGMLIKEKEEEIRKMKKECEREEEKLRIEFEQLEQAKQEHDRQVQLAHQQSQEQSRKAEKEAEEQAKKNQELKRLEQQIAKIQADLDKLRDKKQEHKGYKLFLDKLIEPDVLEERLKEEKRRKEERKKKHAELLAQAEDIAIRIDRIQRDLPEEGPTSIELSSVASSQHLTQKELSHSASTQITTVDSNTSSSSSSSSATSFTSSPSSSNLATSHLTSSSASSSSSSSSSSEAAGSSASWSVTGGAPSYAPRQSSLATGKAESDKEKAKRTEKEKLRAKEKEAAIVEESEENEGEAVDEEAEQREMVRIAEKNKRITALEEERSRILREADRCLMVSAKEEYNWMFFKETSKVNDVLSKLKDDNLFLTEMSQDEEEELDRLQQRQQAEAEKIAVQLEELEAHSAQLDQQIQKEEERMASMSFSLESRSSSSSSSSTSELSQLAEEIHSVYTELKVDDRSFSSSSPLLVLSAIEKRLLFLLQKVDMLMRLDQDMVTASLKKKTQMRFAENRATQAAEIEKKNKERNMAALKRSTGPTVKHVGRPMFYRSPMPKVKKDEVKETKQLSDEDAELIEFFTE
ncbi:putative protein of unknown function (DUF4200) [Monocercomonoides exilis]|uniref:putative protein of unknown function (DUF4200) n=1 Tax=Monocercomonoides exilis TaxID=2049356 RepID=UPI00355A7E89|nr:putative protein of unknown function (DUF4200) [Monocercomonoides exilis]|eukprot:MONOS_10464.1-p1 / transcript=MONOS_10464.1 / gene=MONOS_10464 / organism=Monocercomonoides_exilis_PA203 / gene_product=unspecified product / transcript_product=unspecified product / location=Mono_scaffold00477:18831-21583(-) / protein_length=649 / sequence_SO=supercontig / SO=protein_coding / is_pseudo=false